MEPKTDDDFLRRKVEKGFEGIENTPMNPPDAYSVPKAEYKDMALVLQKFTDEHNRCLNEMTSFEKFLIDFKKNNWQYTEEIAGGFKNFFSFFDKKIIIHNLKEEKVLFPLVNKRMIADGEHSHSEDQSTAIDVLEDDHIKVIQTGTLVFNLIGIASRLPDKDSREIVYNHAFEQGLEMIEMIRLHIYREDNVVFPLAHKLISKTEFAEMYKDFVKY